MNGARLPFLDATAAVPPPCGGGVPPFAAPHPGRVMGIP